MSHIRTAWLAVCLALACLVLAGWALGGRAGAAPADSQQQAASLQPPGQTLPNEPPRREREGDPAAPLISFIDDPTAQCYRPEQYTDVCYIQWQYLQVSATSGQYIISMTVSIDNRMRAYYGGFFQSSMNVPQEMSSPGFRVSCGLPGAGGVPSLGKSYPWTVTARETGGLKAANYGTVFCPADVVPVTNVNLAGPATGLTGLSYTFTASIPVTASLPVTYTWTMAGQALITATNGLSNTQTYTWSSPGVKHLAVEAANAAGMAAATSSITILNPTSTQTPTPAATATATATPTATPTQPPPPHIYLPVIKK